MSKRSGATRRPWKASPQNIFKTTGDAPPVKATTSSLFFFSDWGRRLYLMVLLVGVFLRFWALDNKAMHHDESLHVYYAYRLFEGLGYVHDPMMHGPMQFYLRSIFYLLFGVTDYTARMADALFGVLLILAPLLFRRWLGRAATLTAAALISISPTLAYFSRFARNDGFIAVFTVLLIYCVVAYMESPKARYLHGMAFLLSISLATKENTFLVIAIFGSYILAIAMRDLWRWIVSWGRVSLTPQAVLLVWISTFTLPQLGPALSLLPGVSWTITDSVRIGTASMTPLTLTIVLVLLAVSVGWGLLAGRKVWLLSAVFFYLPYILLYSTFMSNPSGLWTGIWGSLGYWISQQGVERGSQPWYYYLLLLIVYEFLPVTIMLMAAARWLASRFRIAMAILIWGLVSSIITMAITIPPKGFSWLVLFGGGILAVIIARKVRGVVPAQIEPRVLVLDMFTYWFIASLVTYAFAGEKMPWLLVHQVLPLMFLAAVEVSRWFEGVSACKWKPYVAVAAIGISIFLALGLLVGASTGIGFIGLLLVMAYVWVRWIGPRKYTRRAFNSFVPANIPAVIRGAVFTLLVIFTVRATDTLLFQNSDVPKELMVYTQTAPDIPRIAQVLHEIADYSGGTDKLKITVDASDGFSWPWVWYLRDFKSVDWPELSRNKLPGKPRGDVVLISTRNLSQMYPYQDNYAEPIIYHHRWWFPEIYRDITPGVLLANVLNPESWGLWWRYFAYRDISVPLGSMDAALFLPKNAPWLLATGVGTTAENSASFAIGSVSIIKH